MPRRRKKKPGPAPHPIGLRQKQIYLTESLIKWLEQDCCDREAVERAYLGDHHRRSWSAHVACVLYEYSLLHRAGLWVQAAAALDLLKVNEEARAEAKAQRAAARAAAKKNTPAGKPVEEEKK